MSHKRIMSAALAVILTTAAQPVSAQVHFDFANLTYISSTFGGFLPTNGVFCTGGDLCSSNVDGAVFGGGLNYVSGGISATAFGFFTNSSATIVRSAVQDHENAYNGLRYGPTAIGAGLGVYTQSGVTSDDNITVGETLKLSFGSAVTLSSIGLRSEGHNTTNWTQNATFEYSTDNITWNAALLPSLTGKFDLGLSSQDFYFRYGGANADQFYLSSVTVAPEPSTWALMFAGLAAIGVAARRKRKAGV